MHINSLKQQFTIKAVNVTAITDQEMFLMVCVILSNQRSKPVAQSVL